GCMTSRSGTVAFTRGSSHGCGRGGHAQYGGPGTDPLRQRVRQTEGRQVTAGRRDGGPHNGAAPGRLARGRADGREDRATQGPVGGGTGGRVTPDESCGGQGCAGYCGHWSSPRGRGATLTVVTIRR